MFSPQKKKGELCCMMEELENAMVVIVLQYINVSKQHTVHFKLTQCCMLITSQ